MRVCILSISLMLAAASTAIAHPHPGNEALTASHYHENGIGADADGDTNPATDTTPPPFISTTVYDDNGNGHAVLHFEPPPGRHRATITDQYLNSHKVQFGPGVSWQICDGQRYYRYDSRCTYMGATSGHYAAFYSAPDERPLSISLAAPACLAALSVYPIGGAEEDQFKATLNAYDKDGVLLKTTERLFIWDPETIRFVNFLGVYFGDEGAHSLELFLTLEETPADYESAISEDAPTSEQPDQPAPISLPFLIDDLLAISGPCENTSPRTASLFSFPLQID